MKVKKEYKLEFVKEKEYFIHSLIDAIWVKKNKPSNPKKYKYEGNKWVIDYLNSFEYEYEGSVIVFNEDTFKSWITVNIIKSRQINDEGYKSFFKDIIGFDVDEAAKKAKEKYRRNVEMVVFKKCMNDDDVEKMVETIAKKFKWESTTFSGSICKDVLTCIVGAISYCNAPLIISKDESFSYEVCGFDEVELSGFEQILYYVDKYRRGEDIYNYLFDGIEESDDVNGNINISKYFDLWQFTMGTDTSKYWSDISFMMSEVYREYMRIGKD